MTIPKFLSTTITRPLEREFESWIVREIEDYFLAVGRRVLVWAVSPWIEATWPADEVITIEGKVLGLQFKQARVASGPLAFDRLKWDLGHPAGQYELVAKQPEIYYALPTFINRTWARSSLDHCLFWRPPAGVFNYNAWYDNAAASTPHAHLCRHPNARRWGELVEEIQRCTVGQRFNGDFSARQYLARLADTAGVTRNRRETQTDPSDDVGNSSIMYVLYIPL